MKYFTAVYQMPAEALNGWMAKPESERKAEEDKVKGEWDAWMASHKESVLNTISLGKTLRVSAGGVTPVQNGMMLSSYVQAESTEAAAAIFKDHPHLQLPGATIDVMEANQLPQM
jgi:hypothetical protein